MTEELSRIKLSDYAEFDGVYSKWRKSIGEVPHDLLKEFNDLPDHLSLFQLLMRIRKVLYDLYEDKRDYANSFADSRFTPLQEMLNRGMLSCGAVTAIYGSILREFNIPTKFVHGKIKGTGPDERHAWLKIYDPNSKRWIDADPNTEFFAAMPDARQRRVYYDWNELKPDYEKGNY